MVLTLQIFKDLRCFNINTRNLRLWKAINSSPEEIIYIAVLVSVTTKLEVRVNNEMLFSHEVLDGGAYSI